LCCAVSIVVLNLALLDGQFAKNFAFGMKALPMEFAAQLAAYRMMFVLAALRMSRILLKTIQCQA